MVESYEVRKKRGADHTLRLVEFHLCPFGNSVDLLNAVVSVYSKGQVVEGCSCHLTTQTANNHKRK